MLSVHVSRFAAIASLAPVSLLFAATGAHAQETAPIQGSYGVVRAGVALDSGLKFKNRADLAPPTTLTRDADAKAAITGEIGYGYAIDRFRIEATAGYARTKIDRSEPAQAAAFDAGGSMSRLDFLVSGYVDLLKNSRFTPYIGAGLGVARVNARLARTAGLRAGGTTISDKEWGFAYHGTIGASYRISDGVILDASLRQERVTGLDLRGTVGIPAKARAFNTSYSTTSALVGVRFGF